MNNLFCSSTSSGATDVYKLLEFHNFFFLTSDFWRNCRVPVCYGIMQDSSRNVFNISMCTYAQTIVAFTRGNKKPLTDAVE